MADETEGVKAEGAAADADEVKDELPASQEGSSALAVTATSERADGLKVDGRLRADAVPVGKRTWPQRLLLCTNIGVIMVTLLTVVTLSYTHIKASSVTRIGLGNHLAAQMGEPGSRVVNILLVGSDSAANLDPDDPIRTSRDDQHLGDVIIIVHLDERSGEVALLSLPRDLYLPVGGSRSSGRVNAAFAAGGPASLIRTIEDNFAIPIHHYVNVDFAGFQGLVEAVDFVEIYFDTPARDWNTSTGRSQTGFEVKRAGCQSLEPEQALAYVRSRFYQTQDEDGDWQTDLSSDLGRIRRQQLFLGQLMARAIEMGARNPVVLGDLIDTGLQNVTIDQDLTPQTLLDLARTFSDFQPSQLSPYSLPVEDVTIEGSDVLIPIESQIEPVVRLFAGNRFDEPATIGVIVTADGEDYGPLASLIFDELDSEGFEASTTVRDSDLETVDLETADEVFEIEPDTQIVVEHTAADLEAAKTVVASLTEQQQQHAVLVVSSGMAARTIGVSVTAEAADSPSAELAFDDGQNESADPTAGQPIVGGSCG